jgi:hypothetical protein
MAGPAASVGQIARVTFEILVADNNQAYKAGAAFMAMARDLPPFGNLDRGPQVQWDGDQQLAVLECAADDCTEFLYRSLHRYTPDAWQHVRLDIDLVADRYNIY